MAKRIQQPQIPYNAWSVSVFLMLFWGFHYTVLEILHITSLGILAIELFAVATVMLMTARCALKNITLLIAWAVFFLVTLRGNYYIQTNALSRPVAMFLVIVLAYCLQFSDHWYRSMRQCVTIFAWEHFLFAWILFLAQGFYSGVIVPLFPPETRYTLMNYRSQNILMGFTDHYSISGIFFAFGCMTAFISWLQNKRSFGKLVFLLLMLVSLLMTQKRGPMIFTGCSLMVIYFASEGLRPRSILGFLGGAGVLVAVYFAAAAIYPDLGNIFERFLNAGNNLTNGRDKLYQVALELFKKNPIFGAGWGQYRQYSLNYYRVEYAAHNVYLQILAELGITGFVFYLALVLSCLGYTLHIVRRCRGSARAEQWFALLFSVGCQMYFITYGLTGNPIYDPQCFLPYFISLAVPFSVALSRKERQRRMK